MITVKVGSRAFFVVDSVFRMWCIMTQPCWQVTKVIVYFSPLLNCFWLNFYWCSNPKEFIILEVACALCKWPLVCHESRRNGEEGSTTTQLKSESGHCWKLQTSSYSNGSTEILTTVIMTEWEQFCSLGPPYIWDRWSLRLALLNWAPRC